MNKPLPAKPHFTRDLILAFLVLSITVIGAVAFFSAQARRDISQKHINRAADRAVVAFGEMSQAMSRDLKLIRDWGAAGRLSLADTDGLNGLLFPILKRDQVLFGISIADTNGESYYVADVGDGWRTSRTGQAGEGRQTLRRIWNADQKQVSQEKSISTYDPRQRPWFFPALSADDVFWTMPYRFYDSKDVGITAAIASGKKTDKKRLVVALDILLDDLFRKIQRMGPSENSRVFIFKGDAQLYIPESNDTSPQFRSIAEVKDQLIQKVVTFWSSDRPPAGEAFSIQHENQTWWCGFRTLEAANRNIWVGVMVPEADITGGITQRRAGLWSLGIFILVLIGALVFWLTRRYGRSFDQSEDRFDSRDPEESIRRLIAIGEGRTIEFKATMRMNLHTGKTGKEIEIAWLKAVAAFMNTDGGTLLLGVADDGSITGLEADGFANEDKCRLHFKNLINQHIGAELSKHLRFGIIKMEDKEVGVVDCSRSSEPAFLKAKKGEAFYIRSGPSSDELPVSKVVAYLQNRE